MESALALATEIVEGNNFFSNRKNSFGNTVPSFALRRLVRVVPGSSTIETGISENKAEEVENVGGAATAAAVKMLDGAIAGESTKNQALINEKSQKSTIAKKKKKPKDQEMTCTKNMSKYYWWLNDHDRITVLVLSETLPEHITAMLTVLRKFRFGGHVMEDVYFARPSSLAPKNCNGIRVTAMEKEDLAKLDIGTFSIIE